MRTRLSLFTPLLLSAMLPAMMHADDLRWHPLPSFAPNGAVLVVHARNIADTYDTLVNGAIGDIFRQGRFAELLKQEGVAAKFKEKVGEIEAGFGINLLETLDNIAGSEAVFGLYPGKSQEKPDFMLLLRGKENVDVPPIINRLWQAMVNHGHVNALAPIMAGDAEIKHYQGTNSNQDSVYVSSYGEHTLTTNNLDLAKKVVAIAEGASYDGMTANPRIEKAIQGLPKNAQIKAFIDLKVIIAASKGKVNRQIAPLVNALEGIGMGLVVKENRIASHVRVTADETALPQMFIDAHDEPPATCALADSIPRQLPMAGLAARINFSGIADAILQELPEEQRDQATMRLAGLENFFLGGKSLLKDLLPGIGPDLVILASDTDDSDKNPGEATLMLSVNQTGGEALKNLVKQLYNLMQLNANLAEKAKMTDQNGTLKLTFEVAGVTPAIAVTDRALVASSSLKTLDTMIGNLNQPPADNLGTNAPPFKGWFFGADTAAIGQWLQKHSDLLARQIARSQGKSIDQASKELEGLTALLECFDGFAHTGGIQNEALEIKSVLKVRE